MNASVPVPIVIWESLELSLSAIIRNVTKDIAKTLNQSHEPLAKALEGKLSVHLVEDCDNADSSARCAYMCQHSDTPAFMSPCGAPIVWGQSRCPSHLISAPPHLVTKMKAIKHGDQLLAVAEDGTVYSGTGDATGFYDGEALTLLEADNT